MEFAERQAALDVEVQGISQREHLLKAAERGVAAAVRTLEEAECLPASLQYLWRWYEEMRMGTNAGGMMGGHVTYRDIEAWMKLMDRRPEPHEVFALIEIDATILKVHRDHAKQRR